MLRDYRKKRDFSRTSEPPAGVPEKRGRGAKLFVVQRHAARRLHDDFRLAMGGVLASWAVPRGVPLKRGEKRLAVHVEDHPLAYARFEGIIPKGEYGGGTVMVWDIGEYELLGGTPRRALEEGKLHLRLHGKKLRGEWTLVRTRMEDGDQWLLMKTGDAADLETRTLKTLDRSALTGRTMEEIAGAGDSVWHSNREPQSTRPLPKAGRGKRKAARNEAAPAFIAPMKPKLVDKPPTGDWSCELKLDGYRAIAVKNGREVTLYSRNEKRLDFPDIAAALANLPCRSGVFDGEIVALDPQGRPVFQLLQKRGMGAAPPVRYYLFDLLKLDGEDFLRQPLAARRARLHALLQGVEDPLRFSADLPGTPAKVLEAVCARGLEGIIAKRAGSVYEPGLRSGAWVKLKCVNEQEFVIGGYTQPRGSRSYFGALLVGTFDNGKLQFAGRVGTGFDEPLLKDLYKRFQAIRTGESPFAAIPKGALPPAELRRCHWVRPEMVCEVRFTEWTADGRLRQPVFLGLREDKEAREVVREQPATV